MSAVFERINQPYVAAAPAPQGEIITLRVDHEGTMVNVECVRVKQGPYLLGYFPTAERLEAHLGLDGMARLVLA